MMVMPPSVPATSQHQSACTGDTREPSTSPADPDPFVSTGTATRKTRESRPTPPAWSDIPTSAIPYPRHRCVLPLPATDCAPLSPCSWSHLLYCRVVHWLGDRYQFTAYAARSLALAASYCCRHRIRWMMSWERITR